MTYSTRPPAADPWPVLLLSGVDHSLVVDACIDASTSPLIGRTLWVTVGRDHPDGIDADPCTVELVEHDGTYRDVLGAARWATEQPPVEGRPVLLVLDTVSAVRQMLTDEARATANDRARRAGQAPGPHGVEVTRDLWHERDQRWHRLINTIRRHPGPVLLTAYVDEVPLCNDAGDRTTHTVWELQADRNLARSVTGHVQWRGAGPVIVEGFTGAQYDEAGSIDFLWRRLGVTDDTPPGPRRHAHPVPLTPSAERARLIAQIGEAADDAQVPRDVVADGWAAKHGGQPLHHPDADLDELERARDALRADAAAREEATP